MGSKLVFTGLTIITAFPLLIGTSGLSQAGAVVMIIGCVLLILDR